MAMSTTPAVESFIEAATKRHGRMFGAYIAVLVLTALVVALFTWLVWRSGNAVQDAIQADANARIEEAKSTAVSVEHANLILRTDLNTESGKVAGLQKDAADAQAAQHRVEIELSKQREITAKLEIEVADARRRQAEAEERLERIKKKQDPRGVPHGIIEDILKKYPPGKALVEYQHGSWETDFFANGLWSTLINSGWDVPKPKGVSSVVREDGGGAQTDVLIRAPDLEQHPRRLF
jgi:hypothetical protein